MFLVCIDSRWHYLDKWLGKKINNQPNYFYSWEYIFSQLNCAVTKKSEIYVLASDDFISLQKLLIIGLRPIKHAKNA
jgi:hypothetical protein